jgi:hypothetical protein
MKSPKTWKFAIKKIASETNIFHISYVESKNVKNLSKFVCYEAFILDFDVLYLCVEKFTRSLIRFWILMRPIDGDGTLTLFSLPRFIFYPANFFSLIKLKSTKSTYILNIFKPLFITLLQQRAYHYILNRYLF